jgi:hypothetical protein
VYQKTPTCARERYDSGGYHAHEQADAPLPYVAVLSLIVINFPNDWEEQMPVLDAVFSILHHFPADIRCLPDF